MAGAAVTGFGMGLITTNILVSIQGWVAWQRRAVATGLVQFSRTIGGAVGVGIMGGVLTAFVGAASSAILDPASRAQLPPAAADAARTALSSGLGVTYWIMAAAAIAAFVLAIRSMPDVALGHEIASPAAPDAPADAA
jgi:MFS family permease